MSLKEEIKPYLDKFGMVAPYMDVSTVQGSDNGPMFTSEYYIMLARNGESTVNDVWEWTDLIENCIKDGLLNRAPGDTDQEGPDDYYGVFAACVELGNKDLGAALLDGIFRYWGFLNNHDGTRTAQSFLIRQPQLLAAAYAAAGRAPVWSWPLYWYAALVIATSCMGVPKDNADARRLSWLLIQTVKSKSWLCRQASKLWYKRLYNDYPDGMKDVAKVYYQVGHPFQRYWVD